MVPTGAGDRGSGNGAEVRHRVRHWAMDFLYLALAAALPLYAVVRLASDGKTRARWLAYLRDLPSRFGRRATRPGGGPCVWVHGVSVGEVKAAGALIERLEQEVPGLEVVISVTTDTGSRVARRRYPHQRVEFYPPDLSWVVKDALDAIRPQVMILVESEFWPNFLWSTQERSIPVVLVNGRMSSRSAHRFHILGRWSRPLLQGLACVCVQLPEHAQHFIALGVPSERVHVTGNMKFDNIPIHPSQERQRYFADLLGTADGVPLVVGGSTHPGEEAALARMVRRLQERGLSFRLIVAPRHPGRAEHVENDVRREGGRPRRRSRLEGAERLAPDEIVILDSVGELEVVYSLARAVFVGGTLVPHGGHNVMEPSSLGRPVVVGPHFANFRGEVELLERARGLVCAAGEAEVESTIEKWIHSEEEAAEVGRRAREAIDRSKGATERTLTHIRSVLEAAGLPVASA